MSDTQERIARLRVRLRAAQTEARNALHEARNSRGPHAFIVTEDLIDAVANAEQTLAWVAHRIANARGMVQPEYTADPKTGRRCDTA
jgi:hypothetical protein